MSQEFDIYAIDFGSLEGSQPGLALVPALTDRPHEDPPTTIAGNAIDLYTVNFAETYDNSGPSDQPASENNSIDTPEVAPLSEQKNIVLSPELIQLADIAIQRVTAMTPRVLAPLAMFEEVVLEETGSFDKRQRWEFKQALKQSGRLDYLGDGQFGISDRLTPDTFWPGQLPEIDHAMLDSIREQVVDTMYASNRGSYTKGAIMGIVKGLGVFLDPDEQHEFMAALTVDQRIMPIESGEFILRKDELTDSEKALITERALARHLARRDKEESRRFSKKELKAIDAVFHGQRRIALNTVNRKAKKRVYQTLTRSPRLLHPSKLIEQAADRLENGRSQSPKRGKPFPLHGSLHASMPGRQQGRAHGKKPTFEQLLAQATKQSPNSSN